ncbi:enoyl-CoA hydratase/isomerase family protein [Eremococcus coleocola]|uniref:enoyl-CoA hydratase/isomerase family protein n=1 Tax=Eremococcus coleocola TaxID=88132 RepID=UPI0004219E17|nr:enoyl-CoA hydratase/isomerase family protein [Eremococcus coleocola]
MYETILFKIEEGIATISINRPEVGNAFGDKTYDEIRLALEECSGNDEVKTVVIRGEGRFFSAGGDVKSFKEMLDAGTPVTEDLVKMAGAMGRAPKLCQKPVVAMINGAAAGAGAALAMAADFRVMSESSSIVTAFINMAFPGDTGLIYYLQQALGTPRLMEYLAFSKPIKGAEAKELGLTTLLVADEDLESATYDFAKKLTRLPLKAFARQKAIVNEFFYKDLEAFNNREAQFMHASAIEPDHAEAVNAFLEKRRPDFNK